MFQNFYQVVEENKGLIVEEAGSVGSSCLIGNVRVARSLRQILDMQQGAVSSAGGGGPGRVEVVIIAVKQPSIRQAAQRAANILANVHGGVCITLLNGLGHIEIIQNAMRQNDVFATLVHGVFTGGAHMVAPGVVRHVGQGVLSLAVVGGGELDPLSQESMKRIQTALLECGIDTQVVCLVPLSLSIHIHTYIYIHTDIRMIHTYVFIVPLSLYTYTYIRIHTYRHTYDTYVCIYICTYIQTYVCIRIHTHTHTHTHTHSS